MSEHTPHKISIIGAGSAVFSLNIIRDICLTPRLQGSLISLMDIHPDRLEAASTLCRRYASEVGINLQIEQTTDRRTALLGADVVINTALAGGHEWLREGWQIARKHGYRFGGSLHIMHDEPFWINFYQLQLFESIIQDILEICPDAWYIQSANPVMGGITHLARKYPQAKIVGLCHGFTEIYEIARILGLDDRDQLTFEIPGVNHFVWLTRAYYKGEDVFPLLDEWIATKSRQYWASQQGGSLRPKQIDLYKRFGALPIGDTGTDGGGSWGWWYHTDAETEALWQENPEKWWKDYFHYTSQGVEQIRQIGADMQNPVTAHFKPELSHESIIPLIESLLHDIPRVMIVNVQNTGEYVPGIPRDFAVEVPALVSKRGIQAVQTAGLPAAPLAYALRDCVAPWNLELEAYTQHSKQLLLEVVMMDHWTQSEQQARALLDEILSLPYHNVLREHYQ
ncbi:family 4 glycosyl hydrolase [Tengunoibacter tsumagoiensis]|uniref:Alpha-glucosidase n=1 Tax=Tengunoibacter tsumagoiensis TaxID=2014871 RepID=A0A402A1E7_9CHLR|nr:hypothetical protein [Tengunoibacter tsumagoiensis]GCE12869.1 alpha-glucosidase [Tengunoibacter tsumagoiensis]